MQKPISVKLDLEAEAGYVRYAEGDVAGTLDVWSDGTVAADLDDAGKVLGIEVLDFDDETLRAARSFAHNRGLSFPEDLAKAKASSG